MSALDNPPAFPNSIQPDFQYADAGMSLRDWFAGQALCGLLADPDGPRGEGSDPYVVGAYRIADAMLAERAKGDAA